MPDGVALAVSRVDDLHAAALPVDHPGIARLSTAHGIENGTVEDDGLRLEGGDLCFAFAQVGILTEQIFGHVRGGDPCGGHL